MDDSQGRAELPEPRRRRLQLRGRWRSLAVGGGFVVAVAAVVSTAVLAAGSAGHRPAAGPAPSTPVPFNSVPPTSGPSTAHQPGSVPQHLELVAFDTCDAMRNDLRAQTAKSVTAYGLPGTQNGYPYPMRTVDSAVDGAGSAPKAAEGSVAAPDHSTTNVQEAGVGEPDTIETDGRRVVSVSNGVLRVVDAATHRVDGRLDLTMYAGADSAQLLMAGDRLLVILGQSSAIYTGGPVYSRPYPTMGNDSSLFLLVDLSGAPNIIGTLHPHGGFVDARMVDGTARLVVRSAPTIAFPTPVDPVQEPRPARPQPRHRAACAR